MARPKPNILLTHQRGDGSVWDITEADAQYVITYQGKSCGVRQHVQTMTTQGYKYQKLSYTNLGNALAQMRRLNHKFGCNDFDVMEVT